MNKIIAHILKICPQLVQLLVHRNPDVFDDFCAWVKEHPATFERSRLLAGLVLVTLNVKYLLFGIFFKRRPYLKGKESEISRHVPPEVLAEQLAQSDIISFDLFDTLLFRCFDEPSSVFDVVGEKLQISGYKTIRKNAERELIELAKTSGKQYAIEDIAAILSEKFGIPKEKCIQAEIEAETESCFANPYMLKVFSLLSKRQKHLLITSDMYLHEATLEMLLKKNGYTGYDEIFVSCDKNAVKFNGSMFQLIRNQYPNQSIVHVGDNAVADISMAQASGFKTVLYDNVNAIGKKYRVNNMSPMLRSFYSGIVNAHLHNGINTYSIPYEYGFLYGGLFIYGFCQWIHKMASINRSEKIFMIARDGDILKTVYDKLFPDSIPSVYFLWSRLASVKYDLNADISQLFDFIIYKRVNEPVTYSIASILELLDCSWISDSLPKSISTDDNLNKENAKVLFDFLMNRKEEIKYHLEQNAAAAKAYLISAAGECKRFTLVDIGWKGTCPVSIKHLIHKWINPSAEIQILLAANYRSCMDFPNLLSDEIHAYMFSESMNRDLLAGHLKYFINALKFEIFVASQHPTLLGFRLNHTQEAEPVFLNESDANHQYISELQMGIIDFIQFFHQYSTHFLYLQKIPGRDAYMPFAWIYDYRTYYKKFWGQYVLITHHGASSGHTTLKNII